MKSRDIKFYENGADYDIFSNVTDIGFQINLGGTLYSPRSAEAVYQGLKALSSSAPNNLALAQSFFTDMSQPGSQLQKRGNAILNQRFQSNTTYFQPSLMNSTSFHGQAAVFELKEQLMYEILLCKFTQNPSLLKALLNTGNTNIIENTALASYDDSFWGNGKNGNGRNALGIALMRVREDLQRELNQNQAILVRNTLSADLTNQLSIAPSAASQPQYLSASQLAQTPEATTVAAFHAQRIGNAQPKVQQTANSGTAESRVLSRLNELNYQASINIINDIDPRKANQKVIKLGFRSAEEAAHFTHHVAGGYATLSGKEVILGPNTQVFDRLGIGNHGITNHYPMFNSLIFEDAERKRRASEAAQFTSHSPQPLNPTFSASTQVPIANRSQLSTLIRLKEATGDKGFHVYFDQDNRMQFIFSNKKSADDFAKQFGKVWRDQANDKHFSIGQNQEAFVFDKLGIATHGRTNPRPFSEAIRFEFDQPDPNQPTRRPGR